LDETFVSRGHDAASVFTDTAELVLTEIDLAGGSGFTRVDERPKVLERHAKFLSAENHTNRFSFHNQVQQEAACSC